MHNPRLFWNFISSEINHIIQVVGMKFLLQSFTIVRKIRYEGTETTRHFWRRRLYIILMFQLTTLFRSYISMQIKGPIQITQSTNICNFTPSQPPLWFANVIKILTYWGILLYHFVWQKKRNLNIIAFRFIPYCTLCQQQLRKILETCWILLLFTVTANDSLGVWSDSTNPGDNKYTPSSFHTH